MEGRAGGVAVDAELPRRRGLYVYRSGSDLMTTSLTEGVLLRNVYDGLHINKETLFQLCEQTASSL